MKLVWDAVRSFMSTEFPTSDVCPLQQAVS